MTWLVTGGTGLIGSRFTRRLGDVRVLSRQEWDLDQPGLPQNLPDRIEGIVHLAQSERFREFPEAARTVFQVNVQSTLNLLDYARRAGCQRFVLASTGGIRDDFQRELGFYTGTKRCAEVLAECYQAVFHVIVLRFYFVYGPGQRPSMLIPRLVSSVLEGRPITLGGPDGMRLNPTFVDDAVDALCAACRLEQSARIEVAGPEVLTMRGLTRIIGRQAGREPVFTKGPTSPDLVGDIGPMTRLLGAPRTTFAEGLKQTLVPA